MQPQHKALLDDLDWSGCSITDQPHVTAEERGDLDDMLKELERRMHKNGRLDEYRERQHFTKPSERKRKERQAQAYRAEEDRERDRWRGGVEV